MFIKRRLFIGLLKKRRMDADGIYVKKLKAPDRHIIQRSLNHSNILHAIALWQVVTSDIDRLKWLD